MESRIFLIYLVVLLIVASLTVTDFLQTFNLRALPASLALSLMPEQVNALEKSLEDQTAKVSSMAPQIRKSWIDQFAMLGNTVTNIFVKM